MAREELNIVITGNSKNVQAALNQTVKGIKGVGDTTKKQKSILQNFKNNWLAVTATLGTFVLGTKKVLDAFGQQEEAEKTLAAAMKQAGTFTQEAYEHNLKYASSLQSMTKYGDEAILGVQKMLSNFKVEGQMLDDLTKATLDLAAAKGMDLKSAADLVGKSVGSSTNALTRYGIQVKGAVGSTDRMKMAVENITRLFGGSAAAEAKTFNGQIQQMKNLFGDLLESIGAVLAPVFLSFNSILKNIIIQFNKLNPIFQKVITIIGVGLVSAFAAATIAVKVLGVAFATAFPIVTIVGLIATGVVLIIKYWDNVKIAFQNVWLAIKIAFFSAVDALLAYYEFLLNTFITGINLIIIQINRLPGINIKVFDAIKFKVRDTIQNNIQQYKSEFQSFKSTKEDMELLNNQTNENIVLNNQIAAEATKKTWVDNLQAFREAAEIEFEKFKKDNEKLWSFIEKSSSKLVDGIVNSFEDMKTSSREVFAAIARGFVNLFAGELAAMAKVQLAKAIALTLTLNPAAGLHYAAAAGLTAAAATIKALGGSIVQKILAAKEGADFVTSGPQLLLVGDNPSGREHVQVTPAPINRNEKNQGDIIFENINIYASDANDIENKIFDVLQNAAMRSGRGFLPRTI